MRYARRVDFKIKTGQEQAFNKALEKEVVPLLKQQNGFQDELLLTSGREATAISFWDTRQHAESYDETAYPKVLETIKPMIESTPKVQACEVPYATFHATV